MNRIGFTLQVKTELLEEYRRQTWRLPEFNGRALHAVARGLGRGPADLAARAPGRSLRQRNVGWRLDYVFASLPLAARAVACPSFREIGTSDHAPVVASFTSDSSG